MSELTRKKNEASEIMFAMVDSTTPANLKSGLTVTDDPYYKDGTGAWTALSIADAATEIGSTGMYTIEMTAAELNHDLILIKLTSTGAADTIVVIRTTTHDIDDVSTHSAADVWAVATRALTDKAGFSLLSTGADLILKDSLFALAMADAIWDEILTGATHNIPTSAGRRLREAAGTMVLRGEETAQAGTVGSITLAAAASSLDHFYDKATIVVVGGTGIGQARTINEYDGSTKVATICENWITAPDGTSTYVIRGHTCVSVFTIDPDALALINTECDTALTDYDPPTRTEATTDKNAIITEVDANETKIDTVDTVVDAIKAKTDNLPSGMAKNVAIPKFDIFMVLASDHVTGATGKTVTGTISKDGGAFTSLTNSITEVSAGMYTIADGLTQDERNADVSTLKFSADDCDDRIITIISS